MLCPFMEAPDYFTRLVEEKTLFREFNLAALKVSNLPIYIGLDLGFGSSQTIWRMG